MDPFDAKSEMPKETPWKISPDLFKRVQNNPKDCFYQAKVNKDDPEWAFVHHCFEFQRPVNRSIKEIHCLLNPGASRQFEGTIQSCEAEAKNAYFQPQWMHEDSAPLRQKVMDRWKAFTEPYTPFSVQWSPHSKEVEIFRNIRVLPLWHGTKADICQSVFQTGFTYFGKHALIKGGIENNQSTDIGYFGSGIYFTNSARYAAKVYSDGNLLLAWVVMREPYPVIANEAGLFPHKPDDMKKLEGLGSYQNYNAHFIPVVPVDPSNDLCSVYYPCAASETPLCDEFVIFNKSQTLLRFWVELQIDLPKSLGNPDQSISTLLDKIVDLLECNEIIEDGVLYKLLETKYDTLVLTDQSVPLTPEEQAYYVNLSKLLDNTGKVRNFVKKKLIDMPTAAPTQAISLGSSPQQTISPETLQLLQLIEKLNSNEISFLSLQLLHVDQIEHFFGQLSEKLIRLELKYKTFTEDDCRKIKNAFPHLQHLSLTSEEIEPNALIHLQGLMLKSIEYNDHFGLKDDHIIYLKGMPLTTIKFTGCKRLTDAALLHLKGMPLTDVNFSGCSQLTDAALLHLKGMSLTGINFSGCSKLTDTALLHLKGMPLTDVNFSSCSKLTDAALLHLKGMPLTRINFSLCSKLTDTALLHLKGMLLKDVDFSYCRQLTDAALLHLKGMSLTGINFSGCSKLTDTALLHLKGMPLTDVNFSFCNELTDAALLHLKGMSLTEIWFLGCSKLTDTALLHLKGSL